MSSYIDKDKLTQILEERCDNIYSEDMLYENWFIRTQIIDETPTEDVAPIVRGKWLNKGDMNDGECSVCKKLIRATDSANFKYCPNCGAKMEESGETE